MLYRGNLDYFSDSAGYLSFEQQKKLILPHVHKIGKSVKSTHPTVQCPGEYFQFSFPKIRGTFRWNPESTN